MKKSILIFISLNLIFVTFIMAQDSKEADKRTREIYTLIDDYSTARNNKDTMLLKRILTSDIDQMTSGGEFRKGVTEAVKGMLRSSENNPGVRTLKVEKVKFLDSHNALVDTRYEISSTPGSSQNMWSTFVIVHQEGQWKISAIRNMLPTAPR